jgi:hypothetical protein
MQFLRRNRFALLTLAVLVFASVMVVQQYLDGQAAHTQRVEDFLQLHERGELKSCAHRYQVLIQELPRLNDRALVQDLQRTAMFVDLKTPGSDSLVWKYHVSVNNELKQRSHKRLAATEQAEAKE